MNAQPTPTPPATPISEPPRPVPPVIGSSTSSTRSPADGIAVHFEPVDTVLELVVLTEILGGQLAGFPDRHEPGPQPIGKRRPHDEPARFDRRDLVDRTTVIRRNETLDDRVQRIRVFQQRRDVAKHHARPRKIGDRADQRLQIEADR